MVMRTTTVKLRPCAQHPAKSFTGVILIHLLIQGGSHFSDEDTFQMKAQRRSVTCPRLYAVRVGFPLRCVGYRVLSLRLCSLTLPLSDLNSMQLTWPLHLVRAPSLVGTALVSQAQPSQSFTEACSSGP